MVEKINRDLFYKLASDLQEERVQAAVSLIKELASLENNDSEWEYVLNRLIKGLSSNRNSARLGFSLCLTEVLSVALEKGYLNSIEEYIQLLQSTLLKETVKNGKEERGLLFGRMFGLQALLNEPLLSKIFLDKTGSLNAHFVVNFMGELVQVALSKTWIREPCLFTLFQVVEKLSPFLNDTVCIESIFKLLDDNKLSLTNEGLAIYLFLIHLCPGTSKFIKKSGLLKSLELNSQWKNNDPLTKGNLPTLSAVLKDVSPVEDSGLKQKGSWAPRLHFVWNIILPILAKGDQNEGSSDEHITKKRKKEKAKDVQVKMIEFPEFWKAVVDESFFNEKSSGERKYLGFLILEAAFKQVPLSLVSLLFSKNLMRTLINQSSDSKRMLHKISQKALASILELCEGNPDKTVPSIQAMLFSENGTINFDKLTKTKTVDLLVANPSMTPKHLSSLVDLFVSHLPDDPNEEAALTRFLLDSMLHVVRTHKTISDKTWVKPLITSVISMGFFKTSSAKVDQENQDDDHTDGFESQARERLYSILADLIPLSKKSIHSASWPYITLQVLLSQEQSKELIYPLDDGLNKIKLDALNDLEGIRRELENDPSASQLYGLELLLSMTVLQIYGGDTESLSVLEDLVTFYHSMRDSSEENSLIGVIEILLALLAQKKALLRRLSLLVWELFVDKVGTPELEVLFDILSARENKEGFTALFEAEDDYVDEEDDEEASQAQGEESENASDTVNSGEEDEEEEEDGEEEEEEGDDQSEDNDYSNEDINKIDKETTSALAKALNLPDGIINENGEVNFNELSESDDEGESEEDEDEESMDDEKMMELDDQLSQIFQRRKEALSKIPTGNKRKLEAKESRENVIAFKHRVVDMLELLVKFVERTSKNKECGETELKSVTSMFQPLIKCVQQTTDKALADKLSKLIKNRMCKLKLPKLTNDSDDIEELTISNLEAVHRLMLADKCGQFPNLYFSTCSVVSLFLSKLLVQASTNDSIYDRLIDIYLSTMKKWFSKGKFGTSFFFDFINWLASKKQTSGK